MRVIYDAAVLIAADRNDQATWVKHRRWLQRGVLPVVTGPVVAQVSRSPRQARLRRLLANCELVDFSATEGHAVGELLARAGTTDVVDGHLVHIATEDDTIIITGDVSDIARLASHATGEIVVRPA